MQTSTDRALLRLAVAHAKLTLAQQGVLDCERNSNRGLVFAQHTVAQAVHDLEQAIAKVTGEIP